MTSITIALAMSTFVFALFRATRIFSAFCLLALTYLYPMIFIMIATIVVVGLAYQLWSNS